MKNLYIPVVLLVSQDPQLAYLLTRYAETCGCRLTQPEPSEDLVAVVTDQHPDCLLLDISQYEKKDLLALNKLQEIAILRKLPIILYSANDMALQAAELEGYRYLSHSLLFAEFKQVIIESGIQIPEE